MKSLLRAVILTALALAAPVAAVAQDSGSITVPNEDQELNEARDKARSLLGHFWQKLGDPGPDETGFAIKVALPHGRNSTESIWTKDIERKDGKISAVINNVPREVTTVRVGERIQIAEGQISDWMYMRAGKIVGNFTMRPLLKRMQPQDAARYRAMLADP
jgi:uncharacterized protein YegJ (DUF2314 family)